MIRGRGALLIEQLTHFEDDDLIAGRVGALAEFGDGGRRDGRRLIAPAITNESNDVCDLLVGVLQPELRHAIGVRRAFDDQRIRSV